MALIFNHEIFNTQPARNGTHLDRDRLKDTLASLDFDVNVYENRTISEIKHILVNGEFNMFILCILVYNDLWFLFFP